MLGHDLNVFLKRTILFRWTENSEMSDVRFYELALMVIGCRELPCASADCQVLCLYYLCHKACSHVSGVTLSPGCLMTNSNGPGRLGANSLFRHHFVK